MQQDTAGNAKYDYVLIGQGGHKLFTLHLDRRLTPKEIADLIENEGAYHCREVRIYG